jgi:hypothetical protein
MLNIEAASTNLTVFGLTHPGLGPMIYSNRGKQANHYIPMTEWLVLDYIKTGVLIKTYNKYNWSKEYL